ncbi:hypothetical protein D3870_11325 [Noviherbaspirillum cavernae]|uniref:Uncharacterized protein n=3 Tax=Noviherbaspirillum cavernae TaxID=2320862 RepID=A0A418X243_9BURK|nr:hypothetical protein D3870_11325 [Noviherbaspirillum cavernae]
MQNPAHGGFTDGNAGTGLQSSDQLFQSQIGLFQQPLPQLLSASLIKQYASSGFMPLSNQLAATAAIVAQQRFDKGQADIEKPGHFALRLCSSFARLHDFPPQILRIGSRHDCTFGIAYMPMGPAPLTHAVFNYHAVIFIGCSRLAVEYTNS